MYKHFSLKKKTRLNFTHSFFVLILPFVFLPKFISATTFHGYYDNHPKIVSARIDSCIDNPSIVNSIFALGERLGVTIVKGQPKLPNKDATYEALPGQIGTIIVSNRAMTKETYCMLITHEFIHVLQHLKGNLRKVIPLGWTLSYRQIYSHSNLLEAEAYAYQNSPMKIIFFLKKYLQEKK